MARRLVHRTALLLPLAALLAAIPLACGGGDDGVPGSLRLEATVEVVRRGEDEPFVTHISWWFERPARWRWEIANDDGVLTGVADGEYWFIYQADDRTYSRERLPGGVDQPFLPISIRIGPLQEATIDAYIDAHIARADDAWARRVGEERLLGRDVTVVEYGPTSRVISNGSERSTGEGRAWIDPDTMFILRHEVEGVGEQPATIVVTLLETDVDLPDELFEFEPPADASQVE